MLVHLARIAGLALAAVFAVLALVFLFQRRLIYLPLGRQVPPASAVLAGASDVRFRTSDGLELHAWFVPARAPDPVAAVLVLHGNAGHRADRAPLAAALAARGFSVLLADYRGYGGNPGRPSEEGLAADARAAREYLLARPDVDPSRLIYFGESLGAAVALELAIEHPPAALVLRSPFASLTEVARMHYPLLPVDLLLRDRFPSIDRAGRLRCPLLVVAGQLDEIVPAEQSRALYDAAGPALKRYVLIEAAAHNDPSLLDGAVLLQELVSFWAEAAPDGSMEDR
jgi:fermentation-respiration switch protein FrsA (DUF1100 family)